MSVPEQLPEVSPFRITQASLHVVAVQRLTTDKGNETCTSSPPPRNHGPAPSSTPLPPLPSARRCWQPAAAAPTTAARSPCSFPLRPLHHLQARHPHPW